MLKPDTILNILIAVMLVLLGALVGIAFTQAQHARSYKTVCEAKGGEVVMGQSEMLCVQASSFIHVE